MEAIEYYVQEAIRVELADIKIEKPQVQEPMPEELIHFLENDHMLQEAFYQLTPGRRRGYILYFTAPKKSEARTSRIEKCVDKILKGESLYEKYKKKSK